MSLIWTESNKGVWETHLLNHDLVEIASGAAVSIDAAKARPQNAGPLLVRTNEVHGFDRWALICAPDSRIRVNGAQIQTGIRVLSDRDAIADGNGSVVFFSAEQLAYVQPFPGKAGHTCIRCKLPLEPGTPAVRCPAPECGFWHHQSDDKSCWSYTTACASCGHPTSSEAGYQWSPRDL